MNRGSKIERERKGSKVISTNRVYLLGVLIESISLL